MAVNIQSEVCFFTVRALLKELDKKYRVYVIVNRFAGNKDGYHEMANETVRLIETEGFKAWDILECQKEQFDLCLTPYIDERIKAKCYLKYEYGTLNIKPNLTYLPRVMESFHGFLCQSTITEALLSVYGKTFPVDNLRFWNKRRTKKVSDKKQVLFAPTYNDQDEVNDLVEIIKRLKEDYRVIVKGHHGTQYLNENSEKKTVLEELADEYYGSEVSLSDLILKSDVCVFGNSSAIAEALYARVPCVIFARDLDYFKLKDIHTTQYYFVEDGRMPYTGDPRNINEIVRQALTKEKIREQEELAEEIFPERFATGVKGYLDVIEYFLEDQTAQDYIKLHNYNIEMKYEKIEEMQMELDSARTELKVANEWIEDAKKKKLYKVADKIYKIEGRILNGKN